MEERLRKLRGGPSSEPLPSDADMLARVQAIRGGVPPRAAPPNGGLPPRAPPPRSWLPPPTSELSASEEADELMRAAEDAVTLAGSRTEPTFNDASLAAMAATRPSNQCGGSQVADDEAPLVAPSKAELSGLAHDAKAIAREAQRELPSKPRWWSRKGGAQADAEHLGDSDLSDEDEAAEAERLLSQLQDEIVLEDGGATKQTTTSQPAVEQTSSSEVSFPSAPTRVVAAPTNPPHVTKVMGKVVAPPPPQEVWCAICNEDAVVYCADCGNDPFCARCWREGHVEEDDMRSHRTVPVAGTRGRR